MRKHGFLQLKLVFDNLYMDIYIFKILAMFSLDLKDSSTSGNVQVFLRAVSKHGKVHPEMVKINDMKGINAQAWIFTVETCF